MSEDKGSNLLFFLTGAAIGAGLGVLFAPKSGKQTRDQITDWLQDKRDEGEELLAKIKEESLHKKEQVAAAIKAGKQAFVDS